MQISQSDVVRVRGSRWRVADIRGYERCELLTLVGVGPTNRGHERRILAPFDLVERVERRSRLTRVPRRLWRRACRALIAADTPPGSLRSARHARIDLLPHQLEPVLALLGGLGSRMLLADDVGLGKTIQAGLIVSELRAAGAADRVLILTPAGLRDQWAGELSDRFGLDATVLDTRALRRLTCRLPVGINPWQTVPVAIASVDYIKQTEVLAVAGACRWDAVIIDEAHGVAGDSDRRAAVSMLASAASYVVLLTATPHSGDRRAFASLCGIGRIDSPARDAGEWREKLLVFRRSRQDISWQSTRRIHRLHVQMSRDERRMHALLAKFSRAVQRQNEIGLRRSDYWLALAVLYKRALSSASALNLSINRRLAMMSSTREERPDASQIDLPFADADGERTRADDTPAWSPLLNLQDGGHERRLLGALACASERAARRETKITALARLLRRVDEPAIVFTEYRDTLLHLQASLGVPSVTLHGGMTRDERLEAIRHFTHGGGRLLLTTDAGGEGLNLQSTCRLVVNLELPWNPMRLEQRIGRVDRIGQRRPVHVIHLIARDSDEARVLFRLQSRVARARADIGGPDPLGNPVDLRSGDEGLFARLVITGEAVDVRRPDPIDADRPADPLWTPRLESDAQSERHRLTAARALARDGDDSALVRLEAMGPAVSTARHWRTRASLRGRAVMLWRVAAEDGMGCAIGSTIVAVAVRQRFLHDEQDVVKRVDQAAEEWRAHVSAVHDAFISMRLARELTMNESPVLPHIFQPGLFDRRAERARLAIAASHGAADRDRADRLATIERVRTISFLRPQLLLVLEP
jgi:superfamily II DNA or RNA helicase